MFPNYDGKNLNTNLHILSISRDCPENCREAVASLMFAAARFSDLPEIRELRDLFQERYGNSLECFVNQKVICLLYYVCTSFFASLFYI